MQPCRDSVHAFALCAFGVLAGCAADRPGRGPSDDASQPVATPAAFGTSFTLPSTVYRSTREINVYVPDIPDWGKGYFATPLAVLYVVDGGLEQDFFHIAALSNLTLIDAERQPMIVVGVRTYDRRAELTPPATDKRYQGGEFAGWGAAAQFREHLLREVKPMVEARYAVGRQVLNTPDAFDDYIAISPSLWWDDRRLAKQASKRLAQHEPANQRLYLSMADEGGTMRRGLDELLAALAQHKPATDYRFVDRADSDTHASIYHHAARDALKWMFGIAPQPYGATPWYLLDGGQPPAND